MVPKVSSVLAVLLLLDAGDCGSNSSFESLVVFGDSYTENGIFSYTPRDNGTLPDEVGRSHVDPGNNL